MYGSFFKKKKVIFVLYISFPFPSVLHPIFLFLPILILFHLFSGILRWNLRFLGAATFSQATFECFKLSLESSLAVSHKLSWTTFFFIQFSIFFLFPSRLPLRFMDYLEGFIYTPPHLEIS